ncbi:MAG: MerR family transcriptional regulator [Bacteroidales bacterium]|nr:MerR family transcriptional regulator [Bacteroidales bacterium]
MNSTTEMNPDTPVFPLQVASQLSQIRAHSIRQYIDRGLIIPFKQTSNRHLFSLNDVDRLKKIQFLIHNNGLNFAGIRALLALIPCWAIRGCSESDRKDCNAYKADYFPCWEASNKGRICKNENCRECEVYKCLSEKANLKSVIKAFI